MITHTRSVAPEQTLLLKWTNTAAFVGMVAINILANTIPIGGYTSKMVSDLYPTLLTPAPYTFSIWSVIYIAMAAYVFFQWDFSKTGAIVPLQTQIGPWFVISCGFNTAWILFWHFRIIPGSVVCILGLLFSLGILTSRIRRLTLLPLSSHLCKLGFDIYLGWILIATLANIGVLFVSLGQNGAGSAEQIGTAALLILVSLFGISSVFADQRWFILLTILWALFGILIRHLLPRPDGFAGEYLGIILSAVFGIALLSAAIGACLMALRLPKGPDSDKEAPDTREPSDS